MDSCLQDLGFLCSLCVFVPLWWVLPLTFGKQETGNGKRFFEKRETRNWFLSFFLWQLLFNGHIAEFAGVKHLATHFALYVFGVFIARDYAHSRVLTGLWHWVSRDKRVRGW